MVNQDVVTVRNATREDVELLCSWWGDGAIMEHAGFPLGIKTDANDLATRSDLQNQKLHAVVCRLIIMVGSQPVGEMSFRVSGTDAEVGIKICLPGFRNVGVGRSAMVKLLNILFVERGIKLVRLDTMLENEGAQRFYTRLGFSRVGVREKCWVDQTGRERTVVDFELTREDFEAIFRIAKLL